MRCGLPANLRLRRLNEGNVVLITYVLVSSIFLTDHWQNKHSYFFVTCVSTVHLNVFVLPLMKTRNGGLVHCFAVKVQSLAQQVSFRPDVQLANSRIKCGWILPLFARLFQSLVLKLSLTVRLHFTVHTVTWKNYKCRYRCEGIGLQTKAKMCRHSFLELVEIMSIG